MPLERPSPTYARGWLTRVAHAVRNGDGTYASPPVSEYTFGTTAAPAYDPVGNRTAMSMRSGGTVSTHTYGYSVHDRYRLTSATHTDQSNPNEAYWYDPEGNRLTKTVGTTTSTYTYDYENRLTRVVKPGSSTVSFEYDGLGRRVKKTVGATTTLFWYDGDNVLVETNGSGTEQARYTHGPGIDNILKVRRGSTSYYYHEDGLGSVVLITNSSQTATRWYRYDSWGKIVAQTGSSPANTFTYTGREWDSELGLYYYRARHNDPTVGRFLQEDPVGPLPTDTNLYPYVGSNPVNAIDPSGMETYLCHRNIGGEASGPRGAHTYVCVFHDGQYRCNSTQPGEWWDPRGKPNPDTFNEKNCDLKFGKDTCIEHCLLDKMNSDERPRYGWGPIDPNGTNCKKWSSTSCNDCFLQCLDK
jgi:RHS repeat-associated protein